LEVTTLTKQLPPRGPALALALIGQQYRDDTGHTRTVLAVTPDGGCVTLDNRAELGVSDLARLVRSGRWSKAGRLEPVTVSLGVGIGYQDGRSRTEILEGRFQ